MDHRPPPIAAPELTLVEQARMVAALRELLQAESPSTPVELIETHISYVLVTPVHAYKLKKALRTGFLDFTTRALRQHFCAEELRLNRRLAPALYLDVVDIAGSPAAPAVGGSGPPIDHAVRMRAFAQDGLWDRLAACGALQAAQVDELAARLCTFHLQAAVAGAGSPYGTPPQARAPMLDNLAVLDAQLADPAQRATLAALRHWEDTAYGGLADVFAQRQRDGSICECHGDLHLGNVAQVEGRATVFDCIEFNDDFRWIDVMSELAFMAMDLHSHGLHALAHRFVNAYLQRSGDYAGTRVLRYYLVHRALVRAKVAALRALQTGPPSAGQLAAPTDPVRHHLELALDFSRPAPASLWITHGLSGSGKTTATQGLLEAAGAIRVRADVERKRLFGLDEFARSGSGVGAGLYAADATAATYAQLCDAAASALRGGFTALLDATFLQRGQRDQARRLATDLGVPFAILDFALPPQTLRERVRQRAAQANDASEADLRVLQAQQRSAQPLAADEMPAVVACPPAASVTDWAALTVPRVRDDGT